MSSDAGSRTEKNFDFVRWLRFCTIGSTLGIGAAASVTLFFYFRFGAAQTALEIAIFWLVVAGAGLLHGIFFGFFQHRGFAGTLEKISVYEWIAATGAGSAAGWLLVVLPFVFIGNHEPTYANPRTIKQISFENFALIAVAAGAAFGALLGSAQWTLLRRQCNLPGLFIAGNCLGWALGMIPIFLTSTLTDRFSPRVIVVVLCAFGGELAGNAVSLFTFFTIDKMKT